MKKIQEATYETPTQRKTNHVDIPGLPSSSSTVHKVKRKKLASRTTYDSVSHSVTHSVPRIPSSAEIEDPNEGWISIEPPSDVWIEIPLPSQTPSANTVTPVEDSNIGKGGDTRELSEAKEAHVDVKDAKTIPQMPAERKRTEPKKRFWQRKTKPVQTEKQIAQTKHRAILATAAFMFCTTTAAFALSILLASLTEREWLQANIVFIITLLGLLTGLSLGINGPFRRYKISYYDETIKNYLPTREQ